MVEITPELVEDYDAMCAFLGRLDFPFFCDGYRAYAEWIRTAAHAEDRALERAS